jgi:hypothetical protein
MSVMGARIFNTCGPHMHPNDGRYEAGACLWDWQPESAVLLFRQKNELGTAALCDLGYTCPADHVAVASELLLGEPTLLDSAKRLWWAQLSLLMGETYFSARRCIIHFSWLDVLQSQLNFPARFGADDLRAPID